MSDDGLFDDGLLFDPTPFEVPQPDLSGLLGQDARRTARRRARIESGMHPVRELPLHPEGGTCGGCAHLILKDGPAIGVGAGRWWKCSETLHGGHGPDMRKSWPACTEYVEPAP